MKTSSIIGIQFSILSPEQIRKSSVAKIVSKETYNNNKPVIGGIFDPRMGVLEPGFICPTDGLNYIQCPGYFGHLELARPVFYIQYLSTIVKILKCVCLKCSKLLINKSTYLYLLQQDPKKRWTSMYELTSKIKRCGDDNENGCGYVQPEKIKKEGLATVIAEWSNKLTDNQSIVKKLPPELIARIFKRISDEDVNFMGFSATFSRPEWMICEVLAVPPPCVIGNCFLLTVPAG